MPPQRRHCLTQSGEFRSRAGRFALLGYRSAMDHDGTAVPWLEVAASLAPPELLRSLKE